MIIKGFLSRSEVDSLVEIWESTKSKAWQVNRKRRRAYDFLPCEMNHLSARALIVLGESKQARFCDSFFLNYVDGDRTPPHRDERSRERINVCLIKPLSGGTLIVSGQRIDMEIGDAVTFLPSKDLHSVEEVRGQRLIWSVGRTLDKGKM